MRAICLRMSVFRKALNRLADDTYLVAKTQRLNFTFEFLDVNPYNWRISDPSEPI